MFYGEHVRDTRALFFTSWVKYLNKEALSPLEQQLATVILDHPEYHGIFNQPNFNQEIPYFPELGEANPFLHLGLHLAIRDQIQMDRPQGIQDIFKALSIKLQNPLDAEHALMECLAEMLWRSEKDQSPPDEAHYLSACHQVLLDEKG